MGRGILNQILENDEHPNQKEADISGYIKLGKETDISKLLSYSKLTLVSFRIS